MAAHPPSASVAQRGGAQARHDRRDRRGRRKTARVLPALGVGVALSVALTATRVWTADGDAGTTCPDGPAAITVTAAPEIAAALATATTPGPEGALGHAADCLSVTVQAGPPADVQQAVREGRAALPDVWVPDSSLWPAALLTGGALDAGDVGGSIARSPVVLAVSGPDAARLGRPLDLAAALADPAGGLRLGLPDLDRSVAGRTGLLAVGEAVGAPPDGRLRAAAAYRAAARDLPEDPQARLDRLVEGSRLAVPVPEQTVVAHQRRTGAAEVVAVHPDGAGALDYPLVVLTDDPARRAAAQRLGEALAGSAWVARAQAEGFRGPDGAPGPALRDVPGLEGAGAAVTATPEAGRVADAVRAFEVVTRGTRLLAVLDVSGSMAAVVPGTDRQRIDLATAAAGGGLALYGDDAHIGFWVFSTDLAPGQDHRELVPIGPLGPRADGTPGRETLARALGDVTYLRDGDTGLYDTVLEAVRAVRAGWDPDRVNSVVVITDGRNDDAQSIALPQLLETLRAESGDRPVPVIAIAYGPDSDTAALEEITRATGGRAYAVPDPRRIDVVLRDALASRPCRPDC